MCNTYCIFTVTMVAGKRLIVTLYVHYLSCLGVVLKKFWFHGLKSRGIQAASGFVIIFSFDFSSIRKWKHQTTCISCSFSIIGATVLFCMKWRTWDALSGSDYDSATRKAQCLWVECCVNIIINIYDVFSYWRHIALRPLRWNRVTVPHSSTHRGTQNSWDAIAVCFGEVTTTCFGLLIRPSSGGSYAVICAVTRFVPLICVRWLFVQCGAVCAYRQVVCVTGALVRVRSGQTDLTLTRAPVIQTNWR